MDHSRTADFFFTHFVKESRFCAHLVGKFRRVLLVHFAKGYVAGQMQARQGVCRQCGTCCHLLFSCPMLTRERRCLIYNSCRWKVCRVFPIDQRDIDEVALDGAVCGYCFGQAPAENPALEPPQIST